VSFSSALIGKITERFGGYFRKYTVCSLAKYFYAEGFYRWKKKG
jgi:hypothetical protein